MTELIQVTNRHGELVSCAKYFLVDYPDNVAAECGIRKKRRRRTTMRKAA